MRIILALIVGLLIFAGSEAQAQSDFPLYCRGQFSYIVLGQGQMQISLNKAQGAAGNLGVNLKEGTCAWGDRPIAAGEPNVLIFPQASTGNTALSVCSQNTNCTFMVRAYNDFAGRFQVHNAYVWIWNR